VTKEEERLARARAVLDAKQALIDAEKANIEVEEAFRAVCHDAKEGRATAASISAAAEAYTKSLTTLNDAAAKCRELRKRRAADA